MLAGTQVLAASRAASRVQQQEAGCEAEPGLNPRHWEMGCGKPPRPHARPWFPSCTPATPFLPGEIVGWGRGRMPELCTSQFPHKQKLLLNYQLENKKCSRRPFAIYGGIVARDTEFPPTDAEESCFYYFFFRVKLTRGTDRQIQRHRHQNGEG